MVSVERALRALWRDACTIEAVEEYSKPNGAKAKRWVLLAENEPCKLSYYNNVRVNATADELGMAAAVFQEAKLFLRPDLDVPPGSRITVVTHRHHKTLKFENSGAVSLFTNHQEILLEDTQEWA